MRRVTITLDDELMQALDARMRAQGHANRSETVRDLVRAGLETTGTHRPRASASARSSMFTITTRGSSRSV